MDMSQLLRALGLQQAYQAYQQNIGQPFANVAGPFGRGLLGLDKPEYGEEQAYRTGQAVGNMPAVSAPVGAFKAAAQVPGLLVDATQMAKQMGPELAGLLGLTAFHGSPYRFGKFDASKIGTGEGAQAYGHGLYFAENPSVAKEYRSQLGGTNIEFANKAAQEKAEKMMPFGFADPIATLKRASGLNADVDTAIDMLRSGFKKDPDKKQHAEYLAKLLESGEVKLTKGGAVYTVDIPDEMIGRMLDWDKPLSQQSKNVQAALQSILEQEYSPKMVQALSANKTGGEIVESLNKLLGGPSVASQYLKAEGVPGIRYLDQGSRGVGTGTRNFVVFPGEEEALKMLSVE